MKLLHIHKVFPTESSVQTELRKNRYRVLLLLLLSCFHLTNSFVLEVTWSCYCGYSGSHGAGSRGRSSWGLKIMKCCFKFTGFYFAHLFWNYIWNRSCINSKVFLSIVFLKYYNSNLIRGPHFFFQTSHFLKNLWPSQIISTALLGGVKAWNEVV